MLIIGNASPASTVVTVVDGSKPGVEELGSSALTTVEGDCTVVVVGDKPDLAEQMSRAKETIGDLLRKILDKINRHKEGRASALEPEAELLLTLANNGKLPLRVIMNGEMGQHLEPLGTMKVQCMGYVELRELGHVPQSDDPAQQGQMP